jgi:hypothetical protein
MSKPASLAERRAPTVAPTYKGDFYSWAFHQAQLVRDGRLNEFDCANIAEELESLGRSERRSLRSALARIIQHLLKWDFPPEKRSPSWQNSISIQRVHATQDLRENPGLKPELSEIIREAYELGVTYATKDIRLPRRTFPAACPYDFDALMNRGLGSEQE